MSSEMDEIWALFADDGAQSLDAMEESLMALEEGCDDPDPHIAALFRAVHTFKGNSRVLGLAVVESRAHLTEDLIGLVRDNGVPLSKEILDLLLYSGDTLRSMLEDVAATRQDVDPAPSEDLLEQLRALIAKCSEEAGLTPPAEPESLAAAPSEPVEREGQDEAEATDVEEVLEEEAASAEPEESVDTPEVEIEEVVKEVAEVVTEDPAVVEESDDEAAVETDSFEEDDVEAPEEDQVSYNMALDPVYQNIFTGMAKETIEKLTELMDDEELSGEDLVKKARGKANSLSYAAEQLSLTTWTGELDAFDTMLKVQTNFDSKVIAGFLQDLITNLKGLLQTGFGEVAEEFEEDVVEVAVENDGGETEVQVKKTVKKKQAQKDEGPSERYSEIFDLIATYDQSLTSGGSPSQEELQGLADRVSNYAESLGFKRAADVGSRLNDARDLEKFRATQLKFYEEVASIEDLMPDEDLDDTKTPSQLLGEWCADNIDHTLDQILELLNAFVREKEHCHLFRKFDRLVRQCYHTCVHYNLATGKHLSLSLVDLFSRAWQTGAAPGAMTLRLSFSFVDKTRPIFKKLYREDEVDLDPLDRLFEEALTAIYAQNGTVSAKTVEKRLHLPEIFRNILSPESVSTAMSAIQARAHFYILRTDLQDDQEKAEAFFEWIKRSGVKMITNVTVFDDDNVLFDFLIASKDDIITTSEQLSEIDPDAKVLFVQKELEVEPDPSDMSNEDVFRKSAEYEANEEVMKATLAMVEAIGEISASQAMIEHMLQNLSSRDVFNEIDTAIRAAGLPALESKLRHILRSTLDDLSVKIKMASEAEVQLSEQLSQLQQESVAVRSRSAEHLLRQLVYYVESNAREKGAVARVFTVGADVVLDQIVMESLRKKLEPLLQLRLKDEPIPSEYHISIQSDRDRVNVVIEDDGSAPIDVLQYAKERAAIEADGGELRLVRLPDRGVRFHLAMPLHMVVLDGMVVRVGDVNYVVPLESILRIQQGDNDAILAVSAESGKTMLKIGKNAHVPIMQLSGAEHSEDYRIALNAGRKRIFVIVKNEETQMAIPVDELMGQQLVLLRPLRGVMSAASDLSGVALLAGGEVGMVLAVSKLLAA